MRTIKKYNRACRRRQIEAHRALTKAGIFKKMCGLWPHILLALGAGRNRRCGYDRTPFRSQVSAASLHLCGPKQRQSQDVRSQSRPYGAASPEKIPERWSPKEKCPMRRLWRSTFVLAVCALAVGFVRTESSRVTADDGSGHLLIGAGRQLAKHLARLSAGRRRGVFCCALLQRDQLDDGSCRNCSLMA